VVTFIATFIFVYVFSDEVYKYFVMPIEKLNLNNQLIYTGLFDIIFFQIKFSFWLTLLILLPIFSVLIYPFISKALYDYEKAILKRIFVIVNLVSYASVFVVYKFVVPYFCDFLIKNYSNFTAYITVYEYMNIFVFIVLGIFILFLLPFILFYLVKKNIIKAAQMVKYRKHFIVLIFVITGFVAPPDALSQIFMSLFVIFFYEMIVLYGKIKNINDKKFHQKNIQSAENLYS